MNGNMRAFAWLCLTVWTAADVTPKGQDPRCQGHIWIVEQKAGRVTEIHRTRGVLRRVEGFDRPRDVEVLPNGHLVVAGLDGRVVEVGPANRQWLRFKDNEGLYSVRWRPGGNLVIASQRRVFEIDKAGVVVWELETPGAPNDFALLENGNLLLANYGAANVSEIHRERGQLRFWKLSRGPMSVQALKGGSILAAEVGASQVTEWDADGKLVSTIKTGGKCPSAFRTRRGTTLISLWTRVYEIDGEGKTVWEGPKVEQCSRVREF
jgi:hypothetical protein